MHIGGDMTPTYYVWLCVSPGEMHITNHSKPCEHAPLYYVLHRPLYTQWVTLTVKNILINIRIRIDM
jgi:hypothetical protein